MRHFHWLNAMNLTIMGEWDQFRRLNFDLAYDRHPERVGLCVYVLRDVSVTRDSEGRIVQTPLEGAYPPWYRGASRRLPAPRTHGFAEDASEDAEVETGPDAADELEKKAQWSTSKEPPAKPGTRGTSADASTGIVPNARSRRAAALEQRKTQGRHGPRVEAHLGPGVWRRRGRRRGCEDGFSG